MRIDIHRIGVLSELKAQQWFFKRGWDVFQPIDNKTRADFVVVDPETGDTFRVQVKTVQENRVGPYTYLQARLSSVDNVNVYTKFCCDCIFFVYKDRMWLAPIEAVSGLKSVCLDRLCEEGGKEYWRQVDYNPADWEIN